MWSCSYTKVNKVKQIKRYKAYSSSILSTVPPKYFLRSVIGCFLTDTMGSFDIRNNLDVEIRTGKNKNL